MSAQNTTSHTSVAQITFSPTAYPARSTALIGAIHNVGSHQDLLANAGNFARESIFDVLEWTDSGISMRTFSGDQACSAYIEVRLAEHGTTHDVCIKLLSKD